MTGCNYQDGILEQAEGLVGTPSSKGTSVTIKWWLDAHHVDPAIIRELFRKKLIQQSRTLRNGAYTATVTAAGKKRLRAIGEEKNKNPMD